MINVKYDEKAINLLKYFREKGLKKTTCVSLALVIMMSNGYAYYKGNSGANISKETGYNIERVSKIERTPTEKAGVVLAKTPTNEEKIKEILARENLTQEQFDVIVATVIGEAAPGSYEDAYAVINTFYNRKISKTWINEVLRVTGVDNGDNLYAQITLINQSEVYTGGRYKEFLGVTDVPAYQAVIDFLYTLESMHDYLCFFASYGDKEGREQFVDGGNLYYSVLTLGDRVDRDPALVRKY